MPIDATTLTYTNQILETKKPIEIVAWALSKSQSPILTTKFGPGSASLIFLVTQVKPDIPVIWCDTGYNTPETYKFAEKISNALNLNLSIYVPKQTAAYRDSLFEGIPDISDENHTLFTEQVKLEPMRRALKEHNPDLWFTNLRRNQTQFRQKLRIVNQSREGILKVSPFFLWDDERINQFLKHYQLPNETHYFDPSKARHNRECGIHCKI